MEEHRFQLEKGGVIFVRVAVWESALERGKAGSNVKS